MTPKQAILTALLSPTGDVVPPEEDKDAKDAPMVECGRFKFPAARSYTSSLSIFLQDEETQEDARCTVMAVREFDSLRIHYNGQSKVITAREIWEALA